MSGDRGPQRLHPRITMSRITEQGQHIGRILLPSGPNDVNDAGDPSAAASYGTKPNPSALDGYRTTADWASNQARVRSVT